MKQQKIISAAIYVRVSTEEQAREGYSIPAQVEVLSQYCSLYKIVVYKTYKEMGISGKSMKNRPALQELLEDAKKGLFDMILVWKTNRFARNLKELLILVDDLEQHNISFVSYSEKFDTSTPVGRMTMQIIGSIGEFERNTIAENVVLGLQQRFREGKTIGKIGFGYKSVNKQLQIVKEEAEIIRYMFRLAADSDDAGFRKIANILNVEGYRTRRGKMWAPDTVEDILKSSVYIGKLRHDIFHNIKGENYSEVQGQHEAIIDEITFYKVQEKFESRSYRPVSVSANENFLVGILRCPHCGGSMVTRYNHGQRAYVCLAYHRMGKAGCTGGTISATKIERLVMEKLKENIRTKSSIKHLMKTHFDKSEAEAAPLDNRIQSIQNEINSLEENKERYFGLFDNKNIEGNAFIEKINQISNQISLLRARKQELDIKQKKDNLTMPDDKAIEYLINVLPLFERFDMQDKKRWIRTVIKQITITPDKQLNKIEFCFPLEGLSIDA